MRKFAGLGLLICVFVGMGLAQQTPQKTRGNTVEVIKQLERDWIAAETAGDVHRLDQIIADDWMELFGGERLSKKGMLDELKSGADKIQSSELGPMDVKVLGTVAICQGSDTEKSSYKGKDSSGRYVWTDVFVGRNGRWQAVRSQVAMAK